VTGKKGKWDQAAKRQRDVRLDHRGRPASAAWPHRRIFIASRSGKEETRKGAHSDSRQPRRFRRPTPSATNSPSGGERKGKKKVNRPTREEGKGETQAMAGPNLYSGRGRASLIQDLGIEVEGEALSKLTTTGSFTRGNGNGPGCVLRIRKHLARTGSFVGFYNGHAQSPSADYFLVSAPLSQCRQKEIWCGCARKGKKGGPISGGMDAARRKREKKEKPTLRRTSYQDYLLKNVKVDTGSDSLFQAFDAWPIWSGKNRVAGSGGRHGGWFGRIAGIRRLGALWIATGRESVWKFTRQGRRARTFSTFRTAMLRLRGCARAPLVPGIAPGKYEMEDVVVLAKIRYYAMLDQKDAQVRIRLNSNRGCMRGISATPPIPKGSKKVV